MRCPQSLFSEHFGPKFKKVEDSKGEDEEVMAEDDVAMDTVITDKSTDLVIKSQQFKEWQTISHGHAALLRMYEKALAIVGGGDNSGYEDMDGETEVAESSTTKLLKHMIKESFLKKEYMKMVLDSCNNIEEYTNLPI